MREALVEAEFRGDEFNAKMFRKNLDRPSRADKNSAEICSFLSPRAIAGPHAIGFMIFEIVEDSVLHGCERA